MLQLVNVSLRRGERRLFDGLNLTVHAGHTVGVVGRNGVGKSTLFDLVRGGIAPGEGDVLRPESWRLAWLAQNVEPSPRAALDFVLDGDAPLRRIERAIAKAEARSGANTGENVDGTALAALYADYEDAGGYDAHARAGEILGGLGFAKKDFAKPHAAFSGGWRIRLHLARALVTPSDLLLLDEPTNHLDLEATLWLESWVRKYRGTLLIIAHDRDFLDRAVDAIAHLEDGQATLYSGNYSAFERQRAEALERQAAVYKKQRQRIAHMRQFVDRFRAKASKARQAQSRLKALERMDEVAAVHVESPYRFAFTNPRKISNPTLSVNAASLGYGGAAVLESLTLRVYPSDRIGVLGANGAGKTTLLRALAGELAPLAGEVVPGQHAALGYFAQHQLESLDLSRSPREHMDEHAPGFGSQRTLDYLGGWGFRGDDATRPARTFSGGEKARLVLALIACKEPAVLVLDEPTNHLDLDMREALAIALQSYQGALLLVSHDRHLLRRCVDDFWLVGEGRVTRYRDDIESYTALRQTRPASRRTRTTLAKTMPQHRRPDARRLEREQRALEARVERLAERVKAIDRRLAASAAQARHEELAPLVRQRQEAQQALEEHERAWLEAQQRLEEAAGANGDG